MICDMQCEISKLCFENFDMGYLNYKDLKFYKMAHCLAVETHKATLEFPKSEFYEPYRRSHISYFRSLT